MKTLHTGNRMSHSTDMDWTIFIKEADDAKCIQEQDYITDQLAKLNMNEASNRRVLLGTKRKYPNTTKPCAIILPQPRIYTQTEKKSRKTESV